MQRSERVNSVLLLVRRACLRRRPAVAVFGVCFSFCVGLAVLLPSTYQSSMKVVVGEVAATGMNGQPTDDVLGREIQQLTNDDVLRRVVVDSHLAKASDGSDPAALERQEEAVRRLQGDLKVVAFQGPDVVELTYRATSADRAAEVLRNLAGAYVTTHRMAPLPMSSVHLQEMSAKNQAGLAAARAELSRFVRTHRAAAGAELTPEQMAERMTQAEAATRRALLRRVADLQGVDEGIRAQVREARLIERMDAENISKLGSMTPTPPELKSAPPRGLIVLFGLLGSAVLGAATALGLEALSDRLTTKRSVEQVTGIPVLATIPPNAVAPAFRNAFPALYLAMQRPGTAFEGKL